MDACMQWTHKNYYFPRITNLAALKQKIRWQWSSQANESYLDTFDKLLQYLNKDYQNTLWQKYNSSPITLSKKPSIFALKIQNSNFARF